MFADNQILTVFELFMVQIFRNCFVNGSVIHRVLSCNQMKTLILVIKQGGIKRTCLPLHIVEQLLIESPWPIVLEKHTIDLSNLELVLFSLREMSPRQIKHLIEKITSLLIIDNKQLLEMFYNW